jgi:hypothetical protein
MPAPLTAGVQELLDGATPAPQPEDDESRKLKEWARSLTTEKG